jgi:MFS family permease
MSRLLIYLSIFIGSLAISLDFASIDLALPQLEQKYHLNFAGVQWVINGYIIPFAVLMVTGGRLADAYGRKRVFLLGMGLFGVASLLGGLAWSGDAVIAFRVLQGVGAALLWPAMIGLACAAVGESNRGFALGLVLGTCSIGNSAGPVVGGALTQWFSWRWVLWINVPMAILTMLITAWSIPPDPPRSGPRPQNDYLGMALLTGGLVALMVAVYQVGAWGWSSGKTLGLLAVAAVLLGAFPAVERRVRDALMPLDLMRSAEFRTLCLAAMGICQLFFIVLLYFTQYAMKLLGDDPMWAGARVVPFMCSYGIVSYFGGPLYARFGARSLMLAGLACAALAAALLAVFGAGCTPLLFNSLLVLLGLGVGAVIPTISTRAIETAGLDRASLASGVSFMCQLAGAGFLLALTTAIFSYVSQQELDRQLLSHHLVLTPAQSLTVQSVLLGDQTTQTLATPTNPDESALLAATTLAYQNGLRVALWVSTGLVVATLLLAFRYIPPRALPALPVPAGAA